MIRLILSDESIEIEVDIDLTQFKDDSRGEYLDNEHDGLLVVNAVADALKEYHILNKR